MFCVAMLAIVATQSRASPQSVSGNISFSASLTGTKAYLSMALPFDTVLNASVPVTIDSEALSASAFTARAKAWDCSLLLGKLKITDASGFLARPDLAASRGDSLVCCGNLGGVTDPLGISFATSRFSFFLSRGGLYDGGGLQYLMLDSPARLVFGAGALLEEEGQTSLLSRLKPWFALGTGYRASNLSLLARFHAYADLDNGGSTFSDFSWLSAAAGRFDISWKASIHTIKAFLYMEEGNFISATGKVSRYDALADIDYELDISRILIWKRLALAISANSRQGALELASVKAPAFGSFPEPFVLKYWPDSGKIDFKIENKELKAQVCGVSFGLTSAISGNVTKKAGDWTGSIGMDLDAKVPRRALSSLGIGFAIEASGAEQEDTTDDNTDAAFEDIAEDGTDEVTYETDQDKGGFFNLNRASASLRAAFASLSASFTADLPFARTASDTMLLRARLSAKMPHFIIEASGSGRLKMEGNSFSIASARIYVKIPLE